MPKIYINYVITPKKELVISSYHEKTQSLTNAFALIKADGLKSKDLQKLEGDLPESCTNDDIKNKLLELLTTIKSNGGDFNKVTYRGDLNLCTGDKSPTPCLFDGTLNDFFPGKEVQLILESANKEYVEDAIRIGDQKGLRGATLQMKIPAGQFSKTYPPGVPMLSTDALAGQKVTDSLGKVGVFPASKETTSTASVPENDKSSKLNG